MQLMVTPTLVIGDANVTSGKEGFVYDGIRAFIFDEADDTVQGAIISRGDNFGLVPESFNILISSMGAQSVDDPLITWTLTYSKLFITPRYSLL